MNHPSHCTHTCSFWDDSCCTGHDSISATDDRFCSSQSANTANDNNAGIQLLHSLREYEHGLMPNSLSLLDTTDITSHGQLNTDPSLHIPNVITDSTESISTYTFSPSPHQSAANHPYTLQLCLLEGVWCKIQLVSNGFKLLSASACPGVLPVIKSNPYIQTPTLLERIDTPDQKALDHIQTHMFTTFESMDSLLNTISPLYRDNLHARLYNRLQSYSENKDNVF